MLIYGYSSNFDSVRCNSCGAAMNVFSKVANKKWDCMFASQNSPFNFINGLLQASFAELRQMQMKKRCPNQILHYTWFLEHQ